jgi:amino acid permease
MEKQLSDEYDDQNINEIKKPLLINRRSSLCDYEHVIDISALEKLKVMYFQPMSKGSARASILCLVCVTLGTSLLSLPYAMKACGVILCLILFFLCASIAHWTLNLIAKTSKNEDCYEYDVLVSRYYGKNLINLTIFMCLMNTFGSMIAWNKFISNLMSDIIEYCGYPAYLIDENYAKFFFSFIILMLIQIPISTFNSVNNFHILAPLGVIPIVYIVLVSIFEFPYYFRNNYSFNNISWFRFDANFIQILCLFFFAFGNHSTIMGTMKELAHKAKINKLVYYTHRSEIIVYLITMLIGYFSTFDMTNEMYIKREGQGILMVIGKCLYIIVMIVNIALYYYMVKPYLEYKLGIKNSGEEKSGTLKYG